MTNVLLWLMLASSLLPLIYARSEYRFVAYIAAAFIVAGSTSILLLVNPRKTRLAIYIAQRSPHFVFYSIFIFVGQSLSMLFAQEPSIYDYLWGLGYVVIGLVCYFVLPVAIGNKLFPSWLAFMMIVGTFSSAIAIYIAFTGASEVLGFQIRQVQPYTPLGIYTTSSIFFESNRFGISAFFGLLASLYFLKEKRYILLGIVASFLCLAGIIISWNRAMYLGSVLGLSTWLAVRAEPSQRKQAFALLGVSIILGTLVVTVVDPINEALFALGLGRREICWPAAIQIISEKPLLGYGFGSQEIVESMLYKYTGFATSIHSTPLSIAFHAGIPAAALYLIVIFVSLNRLVKSRLSRSHKSVILGGIAASSIAALFLDYLPGGVSYATITQTTFLGLANAAPWLHCAWRAKMEVSDASER